MRNNVFGLVAMVLVSVSLLSGCQKPAEIPVEITFKAKVLSNPIIASAAYHGGSISFIARIEDSSFPNSGNELLCGYWSDNYTHSNLTDAAVILTRVHEKEEMVELNGHFVQIKQTGKKFRVRAISVPGHKISFY